jgi:preprotein translocase subunit Sss1
MSESVSHDEEEEGGPPPALLSRNPLRWLSVFGPGAVIASLTIGAGELIFSSRGGALFGYRLLWFFLLVLALKWALVFVTARHMVLTGAHPFERWMELPGPRGWLPLVFLLLALVCFPIWVGFHAGTVGTLLSCLAGTENAMNGGAHFLWGLLVLAVVLVIVFTGGYTALERIQLVIVLLMLVCVVVSLVAVKPDWFEFLKGFVAPQRFEYPDWAAGLPEFKERPVWVETVSYVGVIGGSGYDYLAYVSYLRDKSWGRAGQMIAGPTELAEIAADPSHVNRRWLRAVAADSVMSFAAVLIFSAVFVACGAIILGPQHKVPGGSNLLTLQAEFVTPAFPWLKQIYFVGAFLTIFGTLYGTIEVAPAVARELAFAFDPDRAVREAARLRRCAVGWVGVGGAMVLAVSLLYGLLRSGEQPPGLIAILTPANLFTGVLACGFICLLSAWSDWKHLPRGLRTGAVLTALNFVAGIVFLVLGIKGYLDHSGWKAVLILMGTVAAGWVGAWLRRVL